VNNCKYFYLSSFLSSDTISPLFNVKQNLQIFIKIKIQDRDDFFSERELMFMFAICRRASVCLSSVTFVHPTQAIKIFGMFLRHFVLWPSVTLR